MDSTHLVDQIAFLREADRLKGVIRRSYVLGGERRENTAEHCWHVALAALLLAEHAAAPVQVARVVEMLLVHDLVEIDAGDTFVYDPLAGDDKAERERAAAERLFGVLPATQAAHLRGIWEEFEARETPDARFAAALDRLLPILHNLWSEGRSWQEHGVAISQVIEVNRHMAAGAPALWDYARELVERAAQEGLLGKE